MARYATGLPLYTPRCLNCTRTQFAGGVCACRYSSNLIGCYPNIAGNWQTGTVHVQTVSQDVRDSVSVVFLGLQCRWPPPVRPLLLALPLLDLTPNAVRRQSTGAQTPCAWKQQQRGLTRRLLLRQLSSVKTPFLLYSSLSG